MNEKDYKSGIIMCITLLNLAMTGFTYANTMKINDIDKRISTEKTEITQSNYAQADAINLLDTDMKSVAGKVDSVVAKSESIETKIETMIDMQKLQESKTETSAVIEDETSVIKEDTEEKTQYNTTNTDLETIETNIETKEHHTDNVLSSDDVNLMLIPDMNTKMYTYMDYTCITNTSSTQHKLQQSAWTDENGLRRYGDDYMIAMGTYYAPECGIRYRITLDNGTMFTAIIGDVKDDSITDEYNMYTPYYGDEEVKANVIEFIVDTPQLDSFARKMGTISMIDEFDAGIYSIERIE